MNRIVESGTTKFLRGQPTSSLNRILRRAVSTQDLDANKGGESLIFNTVGVVALME